MKNHLTPRKMKTITTTLFSILAILAITTIEAQKDDKQNTLGRQFYQAFQNGRIDDFDKFIQEDVVMFTNGSYGKSEGIKGLKMWAGEFIKSLSPRIDLVDEFEADSRGFIGINLNWKHVKDFFYLKANGREGTSVEYLIYRIKDGKISEIRVADLSMDLFLHMYEAGQAVNLGMHPEPIIKGIERRKMNH